MILAADNINAMNPVVAESMEKLDPRPIRDIARQCEQKGARLIDINPGYLSTRKEDRMVFLVETVQEVTSIQLVLDSPNPGLLKKGLAACSKKPILSALTLEEIKLKTILPLAAESGAELVVLLLDERSMCRPETDDKLALAIELWQHATSAGLSQQQLIFDPVMPNLGWPNALRQLSESIKAIRMLSSGVILGEPARTMFGISNLLSGQRRPYPDKIIETCLAVLAGAGLEIALANALRHEIINSFQLIGEMA